MVIFTIRYSNRRNPQLTKDESPSLSTLISAIFLVGGTCIGGGMLALPVASGLSGFIPSLAMMFVSWIMMTATALLLLEVSLWMEEGAHIITMTSRILGPYGKALAWVLFLFISYASLVAYGAAGGLQIADSLNAAFGLNLSESMGCLIFMLFGLSFYLGNKVVGRVNAILFIAMVICYLGLVGIGVGEMRTSYLMHQRWGTSLFALPLLLTAFSFQTIVPSLTPYLKRNAAGLKKAIIYGTSLAFIVYIVWQALCLGIIPVNGDQGLTQLFVEGKPATSYLSVHVNNPYLSLVAEYFAFFALVTSFLGMGLGLYDFLADGLKIKEIGWGSVLLTILVMVPTYFFATNYERVFIFALELSGGFGDTLLNGIIPCLLVWIGRYHLGYEGIRIISGGKKTLSLILAFYVITLIFVVLMQLKLVTLMIGADGTIASTLG